MARETDPLASWGERAGKVLWQFLLFIVGPSTLSGLGLGGLAYATTYSFLYTAAFGFAAFAFVQLGLSLWAIRKSTPSQQAAEPGPEVAAQQPASADTDSRQAQDWESQQFGIPTIEQGSPAEAVEQLKAEKAALKKELEEARSSTSADPRYSALIKELEQLRDDNEGLKASS